jgi:hypothetical protein
MPNQTIKSSSFTLSAVGKLNQLQTDVLVLSKMRDNTNEFTPKMWRGIWDTGATASCINQKIVDDLKLIPLGKTEISTANGLKDVNTYLIDIGLPNNVIVQNVLVSCADLGNNLDLLIGMDIISLGDFAITNVNGRTIFSFRLPSLSIIDFTNNQTPFKQVL